MRKAGAYAAARDANLHPSFDLVFWLLPEDGSPKVMAEIAGGRGPPVPVLVPVDHRRRSNGI